MRAITQKPIEREEIDQLPKARLNRFLFEITTRYPSLQDIHSRQLASDLLVIPAIFKAKSIAQCRQVVPRLYVILLYMVEIIYHLRRNSVYLKTPLWALVAWLDSVKVHALLSSQDCVMPEDAPPVAPCMLRCCILLTAEKETEGIILN
ncbi:MAG: hypothetical protein RMJ44_06180 [Cytophagales bacterium]|nr:hypothetical protein [Bernardetiaceae bacterium]MDW8210657.1 hypothetical protein [Cytophagales bacterium]